MKKIISLGLLAFSALAFSSQHASAGTCFNLSGSFNLSYSHSSPCRWHYRGCSSGCDSGCPSMDPGLFTTGPMYNYGAYAASSTEPPAPAPSKTQPTQYQPTSNTSGYQPVGYDSYQTQGYNYYQGMGFGYYQAPYYWYGN